MSRLSLNVSKFLLMTGSCTAIFVPLNLENSFCIFFMSSKLLLSFETTFLSLSKSFEGCETIPWHCYRVIASANACIVCRSSAFTYFFDLQYSFSISESFSCILINSSSSSSDVSYVSSLLNSLE